MIHTALIFIRNELVNYFQNEADDPTVEIEVGNIALFETENDNSIENKLIITLVNVEEESTLKNTRNFQKDLNGGIRYISPPAYINLYLLFSCNFSGSQAMYIDSMRRLGNVIRFFQVKNTFDVPGAYSSLNEGIVPEEQLDFKLSFELYTLTFEQINHLWGALGGRQLPSVLYKARLVKIDDKSISREGPPIEEIRGSVDHK